MQIWLAWHAIGTTKKHFFPKYKTIVGPKFDYLKVCWKVEAGVNLFIQASVDYKVEIFVDQVAPSINYPIYWILPLPTYNPMGLHNLLLWNPLQFSTISKQIRE